MSFATKILALHDRLDHHWLLPPQVKLLFPFHDPETVEAMERFYHKYYDDEDQRIAIFGINPGRFGAGVTGVPFTDPVKLKLKCKISNNFPQKKELSSDFVYSVIHQWGSIKDFYRHFCITSLCPLGFTKDGKNYNYYDQIGLQKKVEPYIIKNIEELLDCGITTNIAFCMGIGKNYKYFSKLNQQHQFFKKIIALPHPRWVMQYRRKQLDSFINQYVTELHAAVSNTAI